MKTLKLNLLKKNRVHFKCENESGYEVKLKITPKSENLPLGEQELLVIDCSIRTKYGTDIIYELESEIKKDEGVLTFKHFRYNENLVLQCRNLGGRWDKENSCWVFPKYLENQIEELDLQYNSTRLVVKITAKYDHQAWHAAIDFEGYPLCYATGRDSRAKLNEGVSLISGKINSGGSVKNWVTCCEEGAQFILEVPEKLLQSVYDEWNIEILN